MLQSLIAVLESRFAVYLVPIVAILVWGALSWQQSQARHRERIAMIERGMDPDEKHRKN